MSLIQVKISNNKKKSICYIQNTEETRNLIHELRNNYCNYYYPVNPILYEFKIDNILIICNIDIYYKDVKLLLNKIEKNIINNLN